MLGALNFYYKSDKIFFFFYVEKRKTFDSNIFVGQGEQKKSGKILRNYNEKKFTEKEVGGVLNDWKIFEELETFEVISVFGLGTFKEPFIFGCVPCIGEVQF